MRLRTFRIGSLAGIPILINPSWFLLFGLTTWLLATQFYPDALETASRPTHYAMAIASVVLFFVSIILHELAHSLVAKAYRIPVRSITLFLLGGVAQITREAAKPLHELLMAAAGPFTSFGLAALFAGVWFALGAQDTRPVDYVLVWLALMNTILGVFNLLPAFPMDGGRVFRSLVWMVTRNYDRATAIAAWTGRAGYAALQAARANVGMVGWLGVCLVGGALSPGRQGWLVIALLMIPGAVTTLARRRKLREKLSRELRLIAVAPVPARGDRRFKSWNPEEIYPPGRWGELLLRPAQSRKHRHPEPRPTPGPPRRG